MIGRGGSKEIAQVCLGELKCLTRLALESNLIGNDGLEAISQALADNQSLVEIFLYNNDLDDDSMLDFSQMISNKGKL